MRWETRSNDRSAVLRLWVSILAKTRSIGLRSEESGGGKKSSALAELPAQTLP